MMMNNSQREKLPGVYEKKYKSDQLKSKIADDGMWCLIPAVTGNMNSSYGERRLKENDLLFSFIDEFFFDVPYAFEPNMQDGRFVFLPDDVDHQGIGICVSKELPGFLEIGHFWYPCEFTEKRISIGGAQVYIPMINAKPGPELADTIQKIYMKNNTSQQRYCTFLFEPELVITLKGNFMDRLDQSVKMIRDSLINRSIQTKRNGEGLIIFMQNIMSDSHK